MEFTVSGSTLAALTAQLIFVTALPIGLLIWWQKRTHANIFPTVIGMLVFLVFVQILEQILHQAFLLSNNAIARSITANPWLYMLYGGLAAGLFEETGRFMAFQYVLRKHPQRETAISYGIGHGGYECLAVTGLTTLSYLILAMFLHTDMVPMMLEMFTAEEAALIEEVLAQVASFNPRDSLWALVERASAMLLHVSLSVLVFSAVHQPECGWRYLAAIVVHTIANLPAGAYQAGLLAGTGGLVAAELLVLAAALLAGWYARRIWRQLPVTENTPKFPDLPMR